jgi:hypothetical protein
MSRKEQPGRTRVDGRLDLINHEQFAGQAFGKSGVDVQSRQSSYLAKLPTRISLTSYILINISFTSTTPAEQQSLPERVQVLYAHPIGSVPTQKLVTLLVTFPPLAKTLLTVMDSHSLRLICGVPFGAVLMMSPW